MPNKKKCAGFTVRPVKNDGYEKFIPDFVPIFLPLFFRISTYLPEKTHMEIT